MSKDKFFRINFFQKEKKTQKLCLPNQNWELKNTHVHHDRRRPLVQRLQHVPHPRPVHPRRGALRVAAHRRDERGDGAPPVGRVRPHHGLVRRPGGVDRGEEGAVEVADLLVDALDLGLALLGDLRVVVGEEVALEFLRFFERINLTKMNIWGRFRLSIWRVRAYFMDVITYS